MKLLLLGGPRFLGRAIADVALARGHELTVSDRGLRGRRFDAVVDTSGYVPQIVRASAEALAAGLRFSPLDETVRGALDAAATTDDDGMTAEREIALLAPWRGR